MINSNEQKDRKEERKKQEERAPRRYGGPEAKQGRGTQQVTSARNRGGRMVGGKGAVGGCGQCMDVCRSRRKSPIELYREGDQINIRGRVNGVSYALDVSPRLPPADIVKAINRKAAA
jgi:ferredoxin